MTAESSAEKNQTKVILINGASFAKGLIQKDIFLLLKIRTVCTCYWQMGSIYRTPYPAKGAHKPWNENHPVESIQILK